MDNTVTQRHLPITLLGNILQKAKASVLKSTAQKLNEELNNTAGKAEDLLLEEQIIVYSWGKERVG